MRRVLLLLFFINLQTSKKGSITSYAPFALDRQPGSLTDITGYSTRWSTTLSSKVNLPPHN